MNRSFAIRVGIQGHSAGRAPLHRLVRSTVRRNGSGKSDATSHVDALRGGRVERHARDINWLNSKGYRPRLTTIRISQHTIC